MCVWSICKSLVYRLSARAWNLIFRDRVHCHVAASSFLFIWKLSLCSFFILLCLHGVLIQYIAAPQFFPKRWYSCTNCTVSRSYGIVALLEPQIRRKTRMHLLTLKVPDFNLILFRFCHLRLILSQLRVFFRIYLIKHNAMNTNGEV